MALVPLTRRIQNRQEVLKDTTIREFDGGWNVIDNDLNLSSKYAKVLRNMIRATDGSLQVRYGTRLFAECSSYFSAIINISYYNDNIIAVGNNGVVVRIDGQGTVTPVWNSTIAANISPLLNAWGDIVFCSFATFKGDLIICNGIDKPIIITSSFLVTYLQDLATGSNLNVPVCRYVLATSEYLVMGGDPIYPDRLHISNNNTSGTWFGDGAPNDATYIDLGSRVPGEDVIKGIGRFRDTVVVAFRETLLPGTLKVYNDAGDHTPRFDDAIEGHGSISHRVVQPIGNDMLFCDVVGVPSVARALFTGAIRPDRLSQLVDPEIQKSVNKINTVAGLEDRTFAVYDLKAGQYMLFLPDEAKSEYTTETRCFVFSYNKTLKINAWAELRDWNFNSATRSALGRIFFGKGTQVYVYGEDNDPIYKDYVGDQETFSDDTTYTDSTGHYPVADANDSGLPINFAWELAWADFSKRAHLKHARYINFDTLGTARFTAQMFIDNIYKQVDWLGDAFTDDTFFTDGYGFDSEYPPLSPALEMEFIGGDAPGYGADGYGEHWGSGRPTQDERLYAWPAKFKLAKIRTEGQAMGELKIVSATLLYNEGSIRR